MITRDEIINMAQEAASPDTIDPHCDGWWTLTQEELERFFHAAYVAGAAAEREACAKVCEQRGDGWLEVRNARTIDEGCMHSAAKAEAIALAAAIRARSAK